MKSAKKTAKKADEIEDRKKRGWEKIMKRKRKRKRIKNRGIGKIDIKRMKNSPHAPSVFKGVRNVDHSTIVIPFVKLIAPRFQSSKSKLP